MTAEIEIFSCPGCGKATVSPSGDSCRHCGRELHPVSIRIPVEQITGVEVMPEFWTAYSNHKGIRRGKDAK